MNTNQLIEKLGNGSEVTLLIGSRGSGKTATELWLAEQVHNTHPNRQIMIVNYPNPQLLPQWITNIKDPEQAPQNSLLLIDESALEYNARDSMTTHSKTLAELIPIARHKDWSMIFATQNTALSDVNLIRLVDSIIVKKLSLLQVKTERNGIKSILTDATKALKGKDKTHCYALIGETEGTFTHPLPSFWNDQISKGWAHQENTTEENTPETPLEVKTEKTLKPAPVNFIQEIIINTIEGVQSTWELIKWLGLLMAFLGTGAYYLYLCIKEQLTKKKV